MYLNISKRRAVVSFQAMEDSATFSNLSALSNLLPPYHKSPKLANLYLNIIGSAVVSFLTCAQA